MKILHTSDWHLGHRLHEQSQQYEQKEFLEWLIQFVSTVEIDVLLVAGDIFDTGYPSSQSMELFYRFLAQLYRNTQCKQVVMTAGNHDAPGTINAPGSFVRNFDISLIGKATENIED
ncbi:MAG: exonuclease subunit SbcD, partial [Bacteroidales bacterium]|nr:exonuclease subunit SbcD [Bacteroidales bacterium]